MEKWCVIISTCIGKHELFFTCCVLSGVSASDWLSMMRDHGEITPFVKAPVFESVLHCCAASKVLATKHVVASFLFRIAMVAQTYSSPADYI